MNLVILLVLLLQGFLMLVISVVSIVVAYFLFSSKFMHSSPPVPSSGKIKAAMIEDVAQILKQKNNQVVMDLGSGWGSLLLPLAKRFPHHHFVGIEYERVPYWVSQFRARKMKNITFLRQDFFDTDISKANIIFLFLLPREMKKLSIKCQKESPKGTLIYVNRFPMSDVKLYKEVSLGSKYETYYIYKT